MKYLLFADESHITDSRYRSIATVTIPESSYNGLNNKLKRIIADSDVTEFKWKKLSSAKYSFCAKKMLRIIFQHIHALTLSIDVITWDTYDSRHRIQGRDDIANYERMFFHLLSHTMNKRGRDSEWLIFPDQRNGIDWVTINDCLNAVGRKYYFEESIFGSFIRSNNFKISHFQTNTNSIEEPLVQIADLFAGLSIFSFEKYDDFQLWLKNNDLNYSLFEEEKFSFSNRDTYRFEILDYFTTECKKRSLGVSINKHRYLCTFDPSKPINFWHYQPQGKYDNAPTRN